MDDTHHFPVCFTFLIAHFTGLTGETKPGLFTTGSLLRRAITAFAVGFLISFMNNSWKSKSDQNHKEDEVKL